jgi:hypothetical protein
MIAPSRGPLFMCEWEHEPGKLRTSCLNPTPDPPELCEMWINGYASRPVLKTLNDDWVPQHKIHRFFISTTRL